MLKLGLVGAKEDSQERLVPVCFSLLMLPALVCGCGRAKGTTLKGTALPLNAQVGGIAAWSYLLGEGEDVGKHQEKHCGSL